MKSTRKSLWASGLALLVCVALLIGTTFAWFTDSVTSKGNKIQAGSLDVNFEELTDDGYVSVGEAPIFDYNLWEPGYSDFAVLRVRNNGNLALKYELNFVVNGDREEFNKLAQYIDVYAYLPQDNNAITLFPNQDNESQNYKNIGKLSDYVENGFATGHLEPGQADYAGIILKMDGTVGNAAQGLGGGVTFDIQLKATQYASEKDGFGNPNYDEEASYDQITVTYDSSKSNLYNGSVLSDAIVNAPDGATVFIEAGTYSFNNPITISKSIQLVGEGIDGTIIGTNSSLQNLITVTGGGNDLKMSGLTVQGPGHPAHNNCSAILVGSNDNLNTNGVVEIENCKISGGFTKNAITVKGGKAFISNNEIRLEAFDGSASNAIQVDYYADAEITNNTIIGTGVSTSGSWSSCGIGVYRCGTASVISGNTFSNCQMAICVETYYEPNEGMGVNSIDPNAAQNNIFESCNENVTIQ